MKCTYFMHVFYIIVNYDLHLHLYRQYVYCLSWGLLMSIPCKILNCQHKNKFRKRG
jgi:hypothetical protein